MAEVFVARLERDNDFRKLVAIKRMLPVLTEDPSFARRFLDEARMVAKLSHPNLVQVFDMGEEDGRPYLVMELIDGVDLWRLCSLDDAPARQMPIDAVVFIASEVARGLGYVHAFQHGGRCMNIIHRDVSPQNIFISRMGEVKILDFGIAKSNSETFPRAVETQGNAVLGKLRYVAPEQLDGGGVDGRADLYALGICLWELLAGKRLVDSKSPVEIVRLVRAANYPAPSTINPAVTPELDAIVMEALSRRPAERFNDGATMARALLMALSDIFPGYCPAELGELVEHRLPPGLSWGELATDEPSIASLLDAELAGAPQPGDEDPPHLEFVVEATRDSSADSEFDADIASRLEPPVLSSLEPEPQDDVHAPEQHHIADVLERHLETESALRR